MSQNDFTIANQGFPAFRADLNSALQALASNSSGTSAPSTTFANMWWYDSSNNIMYIRNEDNDAWIKFAELDQTNDKFVLSGTLQLDDGTVSAPALTFNSDTNMGIYRGGTDILKFVTAGTDAVTIDASQQLGIGTSTVDSLLHLSKSDSTAYSDTATDSQVGVGPTIYLENPSNSNTSVGGQIVFGMRSTEEQARIGATGGTTPLLVFGTNDAERMRITSDGIDFRNATGTKYVLMKDGDGIHFGASAGSGNTSTVLDDYEEGSWTPVPQDSSGNSGSGINMFGSYVKIGRFVQLSFIMQNVNTTGLTAGDEFRIYGLPFSAASLSSSQFWHGGVRLNNVTFSGHTNLSLLDNTNYLRILETISGATSDFVNVSETVSGSSDFYGSISYYTAP